MLDTTHTICSELSLAKVATQEHTTIERGKVHALSAAATTQDAAAYRRVLAIQDIAAPMKV
jgi:hypothetical protein